MTLEGCIGGVLRAPAPELDVDNEAWKEAEKRTALGLATLYLTEAWERDAKGSANVGEERTRWLDPVNGPPPDPPIIHTQRGRGRERKM